eukprot:GABV01012809.1.p2 GENE.GABV01012809.1~~GABV01012809.1.p2  ORF type:complete len:135 (-),score=16.65 GABV01012809.1:3-383(-)
MVEARRVQGSAYAYHQWWDRFIELFEKQKNRPIVDDEKEEALLSSASLLPPVRPTIGEEFRIAGTQAQPGPSNFDFPRGTCGLQRVPSILTGQQRYFGLPSVAGRRHHQLRREIDARCGSTDALDA